MSRAVQGNLFCNFLTQIKKKVMLSINLECICKHEFVKIEFSLYLNSIGSFYKRNLIKKS